MLLSFISQLYKSALLLLIYVQNVTMPRSGLRFYGESAYIEMYRIRQHGQHDISFLFLLFRYASCNKKNIEKNTSHFCRNYGKSLDFAVFSLRLLTLFYKLKTK